MVLLVAPVILLFGVSRLPKFVAARHCEGGHHCSSPRECCTQGCCPPPYPSGPRPLPPPSEHVLNLFFISHWFFWCVVVAIILAILCAYSLWKKRRTLCGWGFSEHHAQSEGDSAGSCYAPPQYSRCNSFHHPPPPYTEVTSKPDLYPLVFTCNSDNGKSGSSYLMVQYFRNYIVRPAGSLSAASTVDSLSSSFICNINEANTLVPPPYSRAASPEIGFSSHFQQQYMMPRSASQLVCVAGGGGIGPVHPSDTLATQQAYQGHQARTAHYTVVAINGATGHHGIGAGVGNTGNGYNTHLHTSESEHFQREDVSGSGSSSGSGCGSGSGSGESNNSRSGSGSASNCDGGGSGSNNTAIRIPSGFMQSQSDQHFRYIANSNSSISDIFVSNSCAANVTVGGTSLGSRSSEMLDLHGRAASAPIAPASSSTASFYPPQTPSATAAGSHGTPVIYSNGRIKPNLLHRTSTNPTQFVVEPTQRESIYNSCNSIAGISLTVPAPSADRTETEFRDLHLLRHSLETCCQMLQHQQPPQQQNQQAHQLQKMNGVDSPPLRLAELAKKYGEEGPLRSYVTSGTCSGVSSLANIGTPSSPPQATSPTGGEVKEILDQIRQLQEGVSYEDMLLHMRPALRHTLSSPTSNIPMVAHAKFSSLDADPLQRRSPKSMSIELSPKKQTTTTAAEATVVRLLSTSNDSNTATAITTTAASNALHNNKLPASSNNNKRPSTLQHQQQQQKSNRKKFFTPKPNKALYIPMVSTTSGSTSISASRCILKSPVSSMVGANFFANRGGRVRKIWVSRSAPTTPGTTLPPNRLGDDSPLLTEHDEDQEGEQNEEME